MEGLFFTTFRDHMMGMPTNGNRDTIKSLTTQHLIDHKERTFCGKNFNVVVSGNVKHDEVMKGCEWLNKLPVETKNQS